MTPAKKWPVDIPVFYTANCSLMENCWIKYAIWWFNNVFPFPLFWNNSGLVLCIICCILMTKIYAFWRICPPSGYWSVKTKLGFTFTVIVEQKDKEKRAWWNPQQIFTFLPKISCVLWDSSDYDSRCEFTKAKKRISNTR